MSDTTPDHTDADLWASWDAGQVVDLNATDARGALRLAFYGRCSTEDLQDPETSRQWQLRGASGLIGSAVPGAAIVEEYFDIGHSRSLPWKRRPEAMRLLADLDSPNRAWDAIIVGESQRCWAGSQFSDVEPILTHHGVTLLVPELGGAFDPRNSSHAIMMSVHGGLGQAERQRVQDRVRLGMAAQVAQQGRYQGGRPPYGYRAVGYAPHPNPRKASEGIRLKRLEIDENAATVVRRIFDDVLAGKALRTIAVTLNREGILCPSAADPSRNRHRSGDGWQVSTVRAILDNPRYTGYEVWGKFKKQETLLDPSDPSWGHKTRLVRSSEAPIRSALPAHEAIVAVATWQEAQRVLRGRSAGGLASMAKTSRTRVDGTTHALRGIVHCVHCGRKMNADVRAPKAPLPPREDGKARRGRKAAPEHERRARVLWRCRRKDLVEGSPRWENHPDSVAVSQTILLELLADWLGSLFDPANRSNTLDALTAGLAVPDLTDVRRQQTTERLADAQRRLDRLVDSIEAGVDPMLVSARVQAVQSEIATLRAAGTQESVARPTLTRQSVDAMLDVYAGVASEVFGPHADPTKLNTFYREIGLRVDFDAVNRVARADARLVAGGMQNPTPAIGGGVSGCVRGGT